jgi:hypothetical protein
MSRRRGKRVSIFAGAIAMALLAVIGANWGRVLDLHHAIRTGYEFSWMPEDVIPFAGRPLNNSGQVAADMQEGKSRTQSTRWPFEDGNLHSLGTLPGGEPLSHCSAINERGSIVGAMDATFGSGNVAWSRRGFLWSPASGMVEIPGLGGVMTSPADINNKNQVVGTASLGPLSRAFIWDEVSGTRELGTIIAEGESCAIGINDQGWIAGNATTSSESTVPVLWKPGSLISELGLPAGYANGFAVAFNERNELLVNLDRPKSIGVKSNSNMREPFVWSEQKGYTALPVPPGFEYVSGHSINDRGQVLLTCLKSSSNLHSAFLLSEGNLKELPPARKGSTTRYTGLNDRGWLAGFVQWENPSSEAPVRRGFLARPFRLVGVLSPE